MSVWLMTLRKFASKGILKFMSNPEDKQEIKKKIDLNKLLEWTISKTHPLILQILSRKLTQWCPCCRKKSFKTKD